MSRETFLTKVKPVRQPPTLVSVSCLTWEECRCGAACYYRLQNDKHGRCWGRVELSSETDKGAWIHECQGHLGISDGGLYHEEFLTKSHIFLNKRKNDWALK